MILRDFHFDRKVYDQGDFMEKQAHILVSVDGSEISDRAVDAAVSLAEALEATLDVLFVSYFDSDTDGMEEDSWLPDSVAAPAFKAVDAALERAHCRVPSSVRLVLHHKIGVPSEEILAFIGEHEIDIVVMGGRGLGVVQGFLMGSVSQTVLESAPCAVMIVK